MADRKMLDRTTECWHRCQGRPKDFQSPFFLFSVKTTKNKKEKTKQKNDRHNPQHHDFSIFSYFSGPFVSQNMFDCNIFIIWKQHSTNEAEKNKKRKDFFFSHHTTLCFLLWPIMGDAGSVKTFVEGLTEKCWYSGTGCAWCTIRCLSSATSLLSRSYLKMKTKVRSPRASPTKNIL